MVEMPDIARSAGGLSALESPSALEALARYFDAQGGLTFVIALDGSRAWVSSAWARRFGGEAGEFADDPRSLVRYVHPDDVPSLGAFVHTLTEEVAVAHEAAGASSGATAGPNARTELRLRLPDGRYQWFEISSALLKQYGFKAQNKEQAVNFLIEELKLQPEDVKIA